MPPTSTRPSAGVRDEFVEVAATALRGDDERRTRRTSRRRRGRRCSPRCALAGGAPTGDRLGPPVVEADVVAPSNAASPCRQDPKRLPRRRRRRRRRMRASGPPWSGPAARRPATVSPTETRMAADHARMRGRDAPSSSTSSTTTAARAHEIAPPPAPRGRRWSPGSARQPRATAWSELGRERVEERPRLLTRRAGRRDRRRAAAPARRGR